MNQFWCNGDWLVFDDFALHPTDRGLLHGMGLFETLLAVDGKLILPERHLARIEAACARLGWDIDFPNLTDTAAELLDRNQLTEGRARVRLTVTAGSGALASLQLGADRVMWMTAQSCVATPDKLAVCVSPWLRNEHSPLVGLKSASYAENLIALNHARKHGFGETLFFNTSGQLCEAATANVFLVKDGHLFTPPLEAGCLPGITREVVMEMATRLGISNSQQTLTRHQLEVADECFLTASTRGVVAVSRVDHAVIQHGPVTKRLSEAWTDCVATLARGRTVK